MKRRRASTTPASTHRFRRAMTERATCLRTVKMSMWSCSPCHAWVGQPRLAPSREENDLDRVQQDQEIQEEGEVLDVVEIVLELLEGILQRGPVAVAHLRPAGDPRLHGEAFQVERDLLLELVDEFGPLGARADEAHVPDQHVEEMRQLVA